LIGDKKEKLMKVLLCVLLLASLYGKTVYAQEGNNPETKPESDISASTKKLLRKVGRKSMDTTCELTKSKEECEKEKLEHQKGAEADKSDTEKRKMAKDAQEKTTKETKSKKMAKQKIEEKECHEVDGKLQCAGKEIKNKVKNLVE
jgi:hypothetical protein